MNTSQNCAVISCAAGNTRGRAIRYLGAALAVGGLFATSPSAGVAGDRAMSELRTVSAYLSVYSYHCAPGIFANLAAVQPDGMVVAMYESRFRVDYRGDCRAFYLAKIAPRIDPGKRGVVALKE